MRRPDKGLKPGPKAQTNVRTLFNTLVNDIKI